MSTPTRDPAYDIVERRTFKLGKATEWSISRFPNGDVLLSCGSDLQRTRTQHHFNAAEWSTFVEHCATLGLVADEPISEHVRDSEGPDGEPVEEAAAFQNDPEQSA